MCSERERDLIHGRTEEAMTTSEEPSLTHSTTRPPRLTWRRVFAGAAVALVTLAGPAFAQTTPSPAPAAEDKPDEAPKGPNTGRLSISAGVDWTSAYFFR